MKKKTKIVATISDRNCGISFIKQLYHEGMDVVRLNTAHQTRDDTLKIINNVRSVSERIALLLDTKGPEIRTTSMEEAFFIDKGENIIVMGNPEKISSREVLYVTHDGFVKDVPTKSKILIDDGSIELVVLEKQPGNRLLCQASNSGKIHGKKSVNVPCVRFNLPSLSDKDRDYVHFAVEHNIDFIAHSFVRNKNDVAEIQKILNENKSHTKIIAKIENQEGVENIDEILDNVYGVMVARGDLAIEIPYEKIPGIQKMIINKCIQQRKPVIIATQMLHSMICEPRPTRAEVSDIANAIYSKADAIMLSGETANGKYPVEALKSMAKIALEVEKSRSDMHEIPYVILSSEISAYLTKSAVAASNKLKAKAIIADTVSGRTIRNIAAYRGRRPILAQCYNKKVMRQLALTFGVLPSYIDPSNSGSGHESIHNALKTMVQNKILEMNDLVVVVAGNFGRSHGASYIEISTVENLIKA